MSTDTSQSEPPEEVSLTDLFQSLWSGKWLIIGITGLCTAAAFTASQLTPNTYLAEITLSPVSSSPGDGMSMARNIASQFGGIASLAGLPSQSDAQEAEAIALLESQIITRAFIEQNQLLPVLFAEKWDAARNQWLDPEHAPTLWEGSLAFNQRIRAVTSNSKTGLVRMTISWSDPALAATWANQLTEMVNRNMRSRAISDSERNVAYLNEQAGRTNVVELRQVIYSLLQSEISKLMLAKGREEFAFRVIDPAITPLAPISPIPRLWTLGGMIGGLLISALVVFVRAALRRRPDARNALRAPRSSSSASE